MAGSRKPGPLGYSGEAEDLNDGTMIRALSPRLGPIGSAPASTRGSHWPGSLTSISPKPARRTTAATTIQVLRQGSRGSEVQKLQRQLNIRLAPSPNLAVDGIFDPLTLQAVQQYQRGVSIAADGVVGKQTWYHLLKGDKATVLQLPIATFRPAVASPKATSSTAPQPQRAAPPPVPPSIWEWPLEKKLLAVLERVPSRLPLRARDEFKALLQLENLALSLAIIAGFCLLSGGTALVLGIVILGLDMTMSLASALQTAALAATEDELNEAADELAHIVLAVGVSAFIHGVGRIAKGVRGGGKGGPAEAPSKPVSERATSKPKPVQKEPRTNPAPETPSTANKLTGLNKELSDRIRAMENGERPDPKTYMSEVQIKLHEMEFDEGASRLMLKEKFETYGPAQRDGTSFVMPKKEVDKLLQEAKGDKRALERALGLPDGSLDADKLVRIDIPNPKAAGLRIPSGNEAGANSQWLPGGKLPEGITEAVVDLKDAPKGTWKSRPISF